MTRFAFEGHEPVVHPSAWVAPTAVLIGEVTIEENASVWFNVVLRADYGPIVIRAGANVQDNSVLHGGPDGTVIGAGATVGHSCVVHSAVVGESSLVGNGAIVLDGAVIGTGSLIAAGATVAPNAQIPGGVLAVGTPATVKGPLAGRARNWVETNGKIYEALYQRYVTGLRPLD